jgi:TP901 family phage tail tape measure protein
MAQTFFDIVGQFRIADLKTELESFKDATKDFALNPKLAGDRQFIVDQWQDVLKIGQEQMAKGTIDPSALGLSKLVNNIRTFYTNIANVTEQTISPTLKILANEGLEASAKIEQADKQLQDIERRRGQLQSSRLVSETKSQTGFTGKAMQGQSLATASAELEKLKKLSDAGEDSQALKQKIDFYSTLVNKFIDAEKELKKLNDQEQIAIKTLQDYQKVEQDINEKIEEEETKVQSQLGLAGQKVAESASNVNVISKDTVAISKELTQAQKQQAKTANNLSNKNIENGNSLANKATKAFSLFLVFNQLKRVFNDTLRTIKQLDKAMTEAAIVTSMNRKEAWALLDSYQNLAKQTGVATSEIAGVVTQFLRQGRSLKDAMELTEVAAKSARVASISASQAVDFLTSAVNGFGLAATQAEDIADKFAAIAARSATSFEELAKAMSKVAPTAKSAGVGVDFMMGVIAKGIETTREAPENIGTAFKTIFARMREVTDLGKAMEDGMDLNRVEKALLSVGVPLRDITGQFRNLEDVLIDVGNKWDTLTSIEQAYLATALAGSRQQPRLLAVFNDFARTKELIEISAQATGELSNQHVEFMKGSEAALTNLRTAWESFTMSFIDTQIIIDLTQTLANTLSMFADVFKGAGDAASNFTVILVTLATLYAIITSKKLLLFAVTKLQTLATIAGTAATKAEKEAIALNLTELKELTILKLRDTFVTLQQIIAAKGWTTTALLAAKATMKLALKMSLLLIKVVLVLAPIILIVAVIAAFAKQSEIAGRKAEFFAKKVAEINNEIARLNTRQRELKSLTDRFEELSSKIGKSVEELKEMESIAQQLNSVELDGEVFNLSRTDITGKIVIDQAEYDRFLNFIENKREELLAANIAAFQQSIAKDFEGTLNNKTLMNIFASIGFDFAQSFIAGLSEGLSENVVSQLTDAARAASQTISASNFMTDGSFFIDPAGWLSGGGANLFKDEDGEFLRFATEEAAQEYIKELNRLGKITDLQMTGLLNRINPSNLNIIDFDAYEKFINNLMGVVQVAFVGLESSIENIVNSTEQGVNRNAQIFQAQADAYKNAVDAIRLQALEEDWTPEELEQALNFLGATMRDQAILDDLINKKKIDAIVIATLSIDLSMQK